MANYNITLTFTKNGFSNFTQNVQAGDTVTCATGNAIGSWSTSFANNCSASPSTGSPGTNSVLSSFSGSSYTINYSFTSSGNVYGATVSGTVTGGSTGTAPSITSITDNNASAASVTVTVNSTTGSGGTALEYAQGTSSTTPPTTGWQSGNTFSQGRGTTFHYWASRNKNTSLFSTSSSYTTGHINADTSVTLSTNSPVSATATSHTVTITDYDGATQYHIRSDGYGGALLALTANPYAGGAIAVAAAPATAGTSTTYYITATRSIATGGTGNHANVTSYVIAKTALDTTPNPMNFGSVSGAELSTNYESAIVSVAGIDTTVNVSISGGQYRKNGGTYTSLGGTVVAGDTLQILLGSSASYSTATSSTITVGGRSDSFTVTTKALTQNPIIQNVTNDNAAAATVGTTINMTSLGIGGTGIEYARSLSETLPAAGWQSQNTFSGHPRGGSRYYWARRTGTSLSTGSGEVYIGFISAAVVTLSYTNPIAASATSVVLTIANAQANTNYRVMQAGSIVGSRVGNGAITISTVPTEGQTLFYSIEAQRPTTIGGSGLYETNTTFTITKTALDRLPDDFTLNSVTDAAVSTEYFSNFVAISGLGTSVPVTITGGEYRRLVGASLGPFTTASETTGNGDQIQVKGTSSAQLSTTTTVTLTVGELTKTFSITTLGPRAPVINNFTTAGNSSPNETVTVQLSDVGVGGTALEYGRSLNTGVAPTEWQATGVFTNHPRGQTRTYWASRNKNTSLRSSPVEFYVDYLPPDSSITLAAASIPADAQQHTVTISNGSAHTTYYIYSGNYGVTLLGSITGNGSVTVNDNSAANTTTNYYVQARRFTAEGGDASFVNAAQYSVVRLDWDRTPNAFSFTSVTGAELNTTYNSNTVTITGINNTATASITNGSYSVNGAAAVTGQTNVSNGSQIVVYLTSAGTHSTLRSTTLTVGGVSATFSVTTKAASAPTISSITNSGAASAIETVTVNLNPIGSADTPLEYAQTTAATRPSTGWVSSNVFSQNRNTDRYYWASYNKNTSLFSAGVFHRVNYLAPDSAITATPTSPITAVAPSHVVTISDGDANTTYEVRSGSYGGTELASRVGNGAITVGDNSQPNTTTNYFITALRTTALGGDGVRVNAVQYSVVRSAYITTPDVFTFTDITNAQSNAVYTSNEITISGINTTVTVTVSGGSYRRFTGGAWGAYTTAQGQAVAGDRFQLRGTSSTVTGTTVNVVLTVGGRSDTWSITTSGSATDTTPDPLTFIGKVDAELSTIYTSNSQAVASINAQVIVSIAGGEYEKNGSGVWTTQNGTAVVNDTFRVRHTSSNLNSTTVTTTLTIGGIPSTFISTTKALVATGVYGFEVYNASGNKILEVSSRVPRLVAAGTATITVGAAVGTYSSTALTVTGYSPTDDSWQVAITETGIFDSRLAYYYTGAANSVTFKIDRLEAAGTLPTNLIVYYYIVRN